MENAADSCTALPLVPFGKIWKDKVLVTDKRYLHVIKNMLLQQGGCTFNAAEVILLTSKLSGWTATPSFYLHLLHKTIVLHEELELSSLLDRLSGCPSSDPSSSAAVPLTAISSSSSSSSSRDIDAMAFLLHLIARQRRPVVALAEKVLRLCPAAASQLDDLGQTPLHVAAQGDPPSAELVRLLLACSPAAAAMPSTTGKLPIHELLSGHSRQHPCFVSLSELLRV